MSLKEMWTKMRCKCPSMASTSWDGKQSNALRIETFHPQDRCIQKKPEHWPESATALRWIGSGGNPLVFGPCEFRSCPKLTESYFKD